MMTIIITITIIFPGIRVDSNRNQFFPLRFTFISPFDASLSYQIILVHHLYSYYITVFEFFKIRLFGIGILRVSVCPMYFCTLKDSMRYKRIASLILFGRQIINRYLHITCSHKCPKRFKSIFIRMQH